MQRRTPRPTRLSRLHRRPGPPASSTAADAGSTAGILRTRPVGGPRQGDREAQPGLVDLRRVPRIRGLAAVEHRRGAPAGGRFQPGQQPDLLAHLDPEPGRRDPAHPLLLPGADLRRPQLDDHFGRPAADPRRRDGDLRRQPRDAVPGAASGRGARRLRWRQLRQLDVQHHVLLSAAREGLGAGPQRRRRQPRRIGRAVRRSDRRDDRRRGRAQSASRRVDLGAVHPASR